MHAISSETTIIVTLLICAQHAVHGAHSLAREGNLATRERNYQEERAFSHRDSMNAYKYYVQDKESRRERAEVLYESEKNASKQTSRAPEKGSPESVAHILVQRQRDQVARDFAEAQLKMNVAAFTFDHMIDRARAEVRQGVAQAQQKAHAIISNPASKKSERNKARDYADTIQRDAPVRFIKHLRQQNAAQYHTIHADPTKSKKDKDRAFTVYLRRDREIDRMVGLGHHGDSSSHVHSNERASGHIFSAL